jgi:glycosyltransferase involved in cell wall biosynthesis
MGAAQWLKEVRLRAILKRAAVVCVNDRITLNDVESLSGRVAELVPFVVDSRFFGFADVSCRKDYVVVPGDNGRNEELVAGLAEQGIAIRRVFRDKRIAEFYSKRQSPGSLECYWRVPFEKLRELYQGARVVAIPLVAPNRPAGQTSVLEAVACGAPVVISGGRTSSIFGGLKTVNLCHSETVAGWGDAINEIDRRIKSAPALLWDSSNFVARNHSPEAVERVLSNLIKERFPEYR